MNEETAYNDIPFRYKESVGFPISYCYLSLEQKLFIDSVFDAKTQNETDSLICDIECIKDDLESSLELANIALTELKGQD